ncbi:hypothetical protein [Lutimonas sp.]|jgi:hypothetical protein|uniref:hypothetical protein n=1 Tax=Lutimonas sp. TaxID=1872403 RepID=UPI003C744FDD
MKKLIITHLLLNLYLLVLVQPALPVMEYLIHYDYIVSELCENREKPVLACNGKCYLGDQVEKQLDLDSKQEKPLPPKFDIEKFISLTETLSRELHAFEQVTAKNPEAFNSMKEEEYKFSLLRPPIV